MYTFAAMGKPELSSLPNEWETMIWEKSPLDEGVFVSKFKEESSPNSKTPEYTIMAIKINPECTIKKHMHDREPDWTETIDLPKGGNFEISNKDGAEIILTENQYLKTVGAHEIFGIKNLSSQPLYFYSVMLPGFTGYDEIKEVK
jgi:hypothetical protein